MKLYTSYKELLCITVFWGVLGISNSISAMDKKSEEVLSPPLKLDARATTQAHVEEDNLLAQQRIWAQSYEAVPQILPSANPRNHLTTEFEALSLVDRPQLESFHLYMRDDEEGAFRLVRATGTSTVKFIKLYGLTTDGSINYTTMSPPPISKESLTQPRTDDLYSIKRSSAPTKKSSSYPEGCKTYHYTSPQGVKLRFDLGHGTAHADTADQPGGISSTKDPENYVPQNEVYNSPVRRDFEDYYRKKGWTYKEISIYHRNCQYPITARVRAQDKSYTVPIPEGFVLIALNKDSEIQEAYYFPNFVDYNSMMSGQAGTLKDYFSSLYRIDDLQEWFWNPGITVGNVDDHLRQLDLAKMLADRLLLLAPKFFSQLSEQQMPPKARVALLVKLLEWNVQSAASLEFAGLYHQINLVHFYTLPRVFYELDDRYKSEKDRALADFLNDNSVSSEVKNIVGFISLNANFLSLQRLSQELAFVVEETQKSDPTYWNNAQMYLEDPVLYNFFATHTHDRKKVMVGEKEYEFSLSRLNPIADLPKLMSLIGGFNILDLGKAASTLEIVEVRAKGVGTTIKEKLHFMRLYHDLDRLPDVRKREAWERALVEQASDSTKTTLIEKRQIADFYGFRNLKTQKAKWLDHVVAHLEREPTRDNFLLIADWCLKITGAFLQDNEEAQSNIALRASTQLALHIYVRLSANDPEMRLMTRNLVGRLGLEGSIQYQRFMQDLIPADDLLKPFLSPQNYTGAILQRISDLFKMKFQTH